MKIADFFYTSGQVAKLMNVTRVTVWRWVQSGKFNAQYIDREALIPKWEVDLLLENKRIEKPITIAVRNARFIVCDMALFSSAPKNRAISTAVPLLIPSSELYTPAHILFAIAAAAMDNVADPIFAINTRSIRLTNITVA